MFIRRIAGLVILALAPQVAAAQFTTFIPQKRHTTDSAKAAVAATQKAKADSATRVRITNMREWVDSAAAAPPSPLLPGDTLRARAVPAQRLRDTLRPGVTVERLGTSIDSIKFISSGRVMRASHTELMRDSNTRAMRKGRLAPDTASPLPLFALVGLLMLVVGGLLLRERVWARDHA